MSMTKREKKAVREYAEQIRLDLGFIQKARSAAQERLDYINTHQQNIETRLQNLENYLEVNS
jgi:hypothetical protein